MSLGSNGAICWRSWSQSTPSKKGCFLMCVAPSYWHLHGQCDVQHRRASCGGISRTEKWEPGGRDVYLRISDSDASDRVSSLGKYRFSLHFTIFQYVSVSSSAQNGGHPTRHSKHYGTNGPPIAKVVITWLLTTSGAIYCEVPTLEYAIIRRDFLQVLICPRSTLSYQWHQRRNPSCDFCLLA